MNGNQGAVTAGAILLPVIDMFGLLSPQLPSVGFFSLSVYFPTASCDSVDALKGERHAT